MTPESITPKTITPKGLLDLFAAAADAQAVALAPLVGSDRRARTDRPGQYALDLEADAAAWKRVMEHAEAQRLGRELWYEKYVVRIATVTREYGS